jgi:hypothetical protein
MPRLVGQKGAGKPHPMHRLRDQVANSHAYCTVDEGNSQPCARRGSEMEARRRRSKIIKTRAF